MEVKKNELEDFLDENLIRFITDDTPLPSSKVFSRIATPICKTVLMITS